MTHTCNHRTSASQPSSCTSTTSPTAGRHIFRACLVTSPPVETLSEQGLLSKFGLFVGALWPFCLRICRVSLIIAWSGLLPCPASSLLSSPQCQCVPCSGPTLRVCGPANLEGPIACCTCLRLMSADDGGVDNGRCTNRCLWERVAASLLPLSGCASTQRFKPRLGLVL